MEELSFSNAYYIKLGRGGMWEENAIETGKLRLGWECSTVEDINAGNWKTISSRNPQGVEGQAGWCWGVTGDAGYQQGRIVGL